MDTSPACAEKIPTNVEACPHCGISLHQYEASGGAGGRKSSAFGLVLLICAGAFGVLVICGGIVVALMLPGVQGAREAARHSQCKNNLKQIGLALHNYHDTYGSFPPAFIPDAAGKPMHSWRVLILPYLDQMALYREYDFSEPWDGPSNSRLLSRMPPVFACPSHAGPGNTNTAYVAAFGTNCIFRGSEPIKVSDVLDGTSNTILVGEAVGAGIPWMKPEDIDVSAHPSLGDPAGFSSDHVGGAHFLISDGAVRFISLSIDPEIFKALMTRNGGEAVNGF